MWETTDNYCDMHECYATDEYVCECLLMRAEDRETEYQIDLWRERMRG